MPSKNEKDFDAVRLGIKDADKYGDFVEAVADRQREPGFLVVLARQFDLPTPENLQAFAKAMDFDVYTARQRLIAPTPRIIRREARTEKAHEWVEWLRGLGLRAFDISEEILANQQFAPQVALYEEPDSLVIETEKGVRETIAKRDIASIVIGEVKERTRTEKSVTGLMGENTHSIQNVDAKVEMKFDIHLRRSPRSFRFTQDTFHYTRLYPDATGASAVLIRRIIKKVVNAVPNAIVFDDFDKVADILGMSKEIISSSAYLQVNWMRAGLTHTKVGKQQTVLESTAGTFDVYSTLARLEVLRT